ncbi:MAG: sodium:proton antiporter [Planctomycetes bacterium]|nr:sodium:proton antiporter [Planctomycetota bacterium]
MQKVLVFSLLLIGGLIGSQFVGELAPERAAAFAEVVRVATMTLLGFIMVHVGYEFEIEKSKLRTYAVDYGVAATAAAFPWIFCSAYFVWVLTPTGTEASWSDALLAGRFAAPTSAGILFAMLAAAGLSATWLFKKARVLAIFDDLDTVLLMIPLKMLIVGAKWQLAVVVLIMAVLLWIAWRWLHAVRWPVSWPWVLGYAAVITAASEALYAGSKVLDDVVPIHIEVLLPAFVLGCILARPSGTDPHSDDAREGHQEGLESPGEQRIATLVSGAFMVLVGLSMPKIALGADGGWGTLAFHTLVVTLLANLGKMFPLFCYRDEAGWRERLALCIGMWPRGEVGAGVLVVSLGYGIGGPMVTVATLSLALNLVLTGVFIVWAKRLIATPRV